MAITYQSSHPQYYKRLSEYQMSAECNMSSSGEYDITKLSSIMMHSVICEEHSIGFVPPKDAIVKTVKYPGFSVVALGVPRNIWLPGLAAFELLFVGTTEASHSSLIRSNGFLFSKIS